MKKVCLAILAPSLMVFAAQAQDLKQEVIQLKSGQATARMFPGGPQKGSVVLLTCNTTDVGPHLAEYVGGKDTRVINLTSGDSANIQMYATRGTFFCDVGSKEF